MFMTSIVTKVKIVLLSSIITLSSCASRTMIYSSPPAKVYIGGKLKGETPYQHKDMRLTFMSRKIRLEKEGYKPLTDKIRRSEKVGKLAAFFTLGFFFPVLWVGHYDAYHAYVLKPVNSAKKFKANFVKYKEPVKLKSRLTNPIYIGKGDKYHYVYNNNEINSFTKGFQYKGTTRVFESKSDLPTMTAIDAFIKDGKKYILGNSYGTLTAITVSPGGLPKTSTLVDITYNEDIICPGYKYGYDRSDEAKSFIAYNENNISVFDYDLNLKESYKEEGDILEAEIGSDGTVFSLSSTEKEVFLIRNGKNGRKVSVDLISGRNMNFFRLNVDEKLNKVFVSYLISPKVKTRELTKREKRRAQSQSFSAEGVQVVEYNLSTMIQLSSKTILFEKDVVSKADYTNNGGIKYLVNRGVEANEKNTFVTVEEQYIVVVTSENSSKEVLNVKGIIAINASKESTPMLYIPKRGLSSHDYQRLSYNQIVKGDRIHFLFNDNIAVGTAPAIQQIVLDSDMNYLSQDVFNLYKEGKTLLNTMRSYKLENGTNLILHMRKKRIGAAIIDFE